MDMGRGDALMFDPAGLSGFEFLGSTKLAAAAASTAIVTVEPRDALLIVFRVTGYSGADIASLRFGGTAGAVDTGANYWDRHLNAAAGATTFTNAQNVSGTLIRLAGATSTLQRAGAVWVNNLATVSKVCRIDVQTSTGAANTAGILDVGGGEWVNTTQQIRSVQMLDAGANNLNAGSGFAVYGRDL
jgi:hypothetical protein